MAFTNIPHTWSTHPSWVAEEPHRFWSHWVKGHRSQMFQNYSDCLINNFPKWISSLFICATYFEQTNPVVQHICEKKALWGIVFINVSCLYFDCVIYSILSVVYTLDLSTSRLIRAMVPYHSHLSLLNHVVFRALWKIDVQLISTLVN